MTHREQFSLNGEYTCSSSPPLVDRLHLAFGFLASQEVKDAGVGNLGLRDRAFPHNLLRIVTNLKRRLERLALYWVQKYICAFGGDPTKVTM
jgi:acetylcholinesterase